MRCENKTFLQNDPGFLQEISSTAVEVGLESALNGPPGKILRSHHQATAHRFAACPEGQKLRRTFEI